MEVLAHFLRDVDGNRTGVRLLFGDAVSRQQVNDGLGLDLQLASEFIDSDLIRIGHAY